MRGGGCYGMRWMDYWMDGSPDERDDTRLAIITLSTSPVHLLLVPIDSKKRWFCPILSYLLVAVSFLRWRID